MCVSAVFYFVARWPGALIGRCYEAKHLQTPKETALAIQKDWVHSEWPEDKHNVAGPLY